jgi:hypothetical protein
MSAWIKCTTMFDEVVYLNMADARIISPLATGLSRVTFRQADKDFVDVKESATDLIAAAKAAAY